MERRIFGEPFPPEDNALGRRGRLLELPRVPFAPHCLFRLRQNLRIETSGIEDVAFLPDNFSAAFGKAYHHALRRFRWKAQMRIAQIFRKDVSRQVVFVETLHNHDERARLGIV